MYQRGPGGAKIHRVDVAVGAVRHSNGMQHSGAVIMHADADAFFASVEQRDDARYRGAPMVVGEQVVACASYEARALGIHAGMPLGQVRRRWPATLVAPVRGAAYEEASAGLFAVFRRFTPLVEPGSMEEAFLDVTGHEHGRHAHPGGVAAAIRDAVRQEVGLPVSIGVGRTKLMAKLASRRAKPDGVLVVDATLEARVRPRLRLDDLWGVGPATYEKLHSAGLFVVSDLYGLSVGDLLGQGLTTAMARRVVSIAAGTDDATIPAARPAGVGQCDAVVWGNSHPFHGRGGAAHVGATCPGPVGRRRTVTHSSRGDGALRRRGAGHRACVTA